MPRIMLTKIAVMIATYPLSFFVDFLIFSNKIYFGARWVDDWDQWKKIEPKKIMIRRRGVAPLAGLYEPAIFVI